MIFEQPRELEQFARPAVPWTWTRVRTLIKTSMPLLAFYVAVTTETLLLRNRSILPAIDVGLVFFFIIIAFAMIADSRRIPSKRTLELNDKGLTAQPCPVRRIEWRHLLGVLIEPAGIQGELKKVGFYYLCRSRRLPRCWPIVFSDPVQYEHLLSDLRERQEAGVANFSVKIHDAPVSPRKALAVTTGWLWLYVLGMLLVFHGLPFLASGIFGPDPYNRHEPVNPHVTAWFREIGASHNPREFLIITGAILSAAGGGIMAAASAIYYKRMKAYRAENPPIFDIPAQRN
jgi:hypothetical protein